MAAPRLPTALTPLELAAGSPLGLDPSAPPLPEPDSGLNAREALERTVIAALQRSPCVVAFSGGRDSSAMLALAVHVARREGLPEPIAYTQRFPRASRSIEDDWQELMIEHTGVQEWCRQEFSGELDALGPYARRRLLAHGLIWPPNAHTQIPVFEAARGGSVVTGLDGDGALGGWRWKRLDRLLVEPRAARPADIRLAASAVLPRLAGERIMARRARAMPGWLRPPAREAVARARAELLLREPLSWRSRVDYFSRRRHLRLTQAGLDLLAAEHGVAAVHPILNPSFLSALSREWRPGRFSTRGRAMDYLFGDLLTSKLIERRTKAEFGQALFAAESLAFAKRWDGASGIDPDLVDPDALRGVWLGSDPIDFRSAVPLQAAWLASSGNAR